MMGASDPQPNLFYYNISLETFVPTGLRPHDALSK